MKKTGYIDLLRHGETEGGSRFNGSTDAALTDKGWLQLWQSVAGRDRCWDRIISSPLSRCAHFASELAEVRKLPLLLDDRFREMHFGAWEGYSAIELMATDAESLAQFWQDPVRNTPPLAEALEQFQQRVLSAWHEMVAAWPGESVLLVTHGGVIRTILCHVQHRPLEQLLQIEAGHAVLHRVETGGQTGAVCRERQSVLAEEKV